MIREMSQLASTDYIKIFPLIPSIKKIANEFEGEEKKVVLEFLLRDALSKTASEIVSESRQIAASNSTQTEIEPENKDAVEMPAKALSTQTHETLDTSAVEAFKKRQNVSHNDLEKLFLKKDEKIERLYATLNTTKKSEAQVRITLLKCLSNAIQNGQFSASMKDIVSECKEFGMYDKNFTKNLKSRQQLFTSPLNEQVHLSAEGEKELAVLIKELTLQES